MAQTIRHLALTLGPNRSTSPFYAPKAAASPNLRRMTALRPKLYGKRRPAAYTPLAALPQNLTMIRKMMGKMTATQRQVLAAVSAGSSSCKFSKALPRRGSRAKHLILFQSVAWIGCLFWTWGLLQLFELWCNRRGLDTVRYSLPTILDCLC